MKIQVKVAQSFIFRVDIAPEDPNYSMNFCFQTFKDYKINVVDSGYGDESHTEVGLQNDGN